MFAQFRVALPGDRDQGHHYGGERQIPDLRERFPSNARCCEARSDLGLPVNIWIGCQTLKKYLADAQAVTYGRMCVYPARLMNPGRTSASASSSSSRNRRRLSRSHVSPVRRLAEENIWRLTVSASNRLCRRSTN